MRSATLPRRHNIIGIIGSVGAVAGFNGDPGHHRPGPCTTTFNESASSTPSRTTASWPHHFTAPNQTRGSGVHPHRRPAKERSLYKSHDQRRATRCRWLVDSNKGRRYAMGREKTETRATNSTSCTRTWSGGVAQVAMPLLR